MKSIYRFADEDRYAVELMFSGLPANPYTDYESFHRTVRELIDREAFPASFVEACHQVKRQRVQAVTYAHVLANCPLDGDIPVFDQDDPVKDKYTKKKTFVGEAMLELVGQLTGTPLLAYVTRNNGDFFHDVYAANRYSGTQTQKSDTDLFWHNDRTAHAVRADYLALLGMRCPADDLVYTGYVDGRQLLEHISEESQALLRRRDFVTPFDEYSRASNENQIVSEPHAVLENEHSFRYYDTRTRPANRDSAAHYEALMQLRDGLVKAKQQRHRIKVGDMLLIANQDGLHNRSLVDVSDPDTTRLRWLLKTYAFKDDATADIHAAQWADGVRGRVRD
jgi:hypothetical protein